ncbi:hypothetical protein CHUAL_008569 [Chamberlinius hualienensis]
MYNPVLNVDISIFALPDGEVYICQGFINHHHNKGVETVLNDEINDQNCDVDVRYDISLLHHSCILHCQVKGKIPNSVKSNNNIMFVPIKDSLLVFLPGVFTHLLDVGLEHDPCNHVLLYGCLLPFLDSDDLVNVMINSHSNRSFSYLSCHQHEIRQYSVCVTNESLLQTFESVDGTLAQQNIVHHLLVHFDDIENSEKLMKNLKMEPTEHNVVKLFEEYLLGGSFAQAKRRLDKKFCQLLPMSVAQPFHPQQQMYLDGQLQMTLTYTMLKNVKSVLLSPTERHVTQQRAIDMWQRLWSRSAVHINPKSTRFSSKSLRDRVVAMGNQQKCSQHQPSLSTSAIGNYPFCPLSHISQDCPVHPAASFCRKFIGQPNTKDQPNANLPVEESVEKFAGDCYSKLEQVVFLNLKEISAHLAKCLPAAPSNVIKECASTYVAECMEQSQRLCHIIFELTNIKSSSQDFDYDPYLYLNSLKPGEARQLFLWLERYFVAVEEVVFPLPKGFDAFFSVLAYKCLNIRAFLQYVDNGVAQLNVEVLRCLTADAKAVVKTMPKLPLYDDNIMLEIISRLPKVVALQFLQNLQCSTTRLLQVHHIVERYCSHQCNPVKNEVVAVNDLTTGGDNVANPAGSSDNQVSYFSGSSDDEVNLSACENVDLPQPIITAITAFMCFLQEGDFSAALHQDKRRSKKPLRGPCASVSAMKLMKETQLRNLVNHDLTKTKEKQLEKLQMRPTFIYWR